MINKDGLYKDIWSILNPLQGQNKVRREKKIKNNKRSHST
jgi:hypothetical protein